MIDVYATAGTFADPKHLATRLADALMGIEGVPDIPMFRQNTAAFVHEMPANSVSNVDGDGRYVRVQVLTNASALDRGKQLEVVQQFTALVTPARSGDRPDLLLVKTEPVLIEAFPDPIHPAHFGDANRHVRIRRMMHVNAIASFHFR